MEDVKNAKELLDETLNILNEKKIASKALAEVNKRVLEATSGNKSFWNLLTKAYANKGKAWVADNPLSLNSEEKHRDAISPIFIKLAELVSATEAFNQTDEILSEYLDALEAIGITIKIDSEKFTHFDTDSSIVDELKAAKSFKATIESYNDEIKEEHSAKAEDLNFAPKTGYMKVANIYRRGISGKDIDDTVQNILTYNEFIDRAVNLVADYAKDINNTSI